MQSTRDTQYSSRKQLYGISEQNYIQQVSIDCVIFGYQDRQLYVLLTQFNLQVDFRALPGGFIHQDEDLDQAARGILQGRTGIKDIYLEQFHTFGGVSRNAGAFVDHLIGLNPEEEQQFRSIYEWITRRFLSVGYYALVDMNQVTLLKTELDESLWYPIKDLPPLIIDHQEIIGKALESLQLDLDRKLIGFKLLPETFTMSELQALYEAVYDKPFANNNFQRKMLSLNVLERLEKKFTGAANKAPYLYRFLK